MRAGLFAARLVARLFARVPLFECEFALLARVRFVCVGYSVCMCVCVCVCVCVCE